MKRSLILLFSLTAALHASENAAIKLGPDQIQILKKNVFEVILKKPTADSLIYAKPLPFDELPYAMRMDEYYSIGSAFPISTDEMVTAFHVLSPGYGGLNRNFFIRDSDGKVFAIDKVRSFSNRRDYITFSLKGRKFSNWFKPGSSILLQHKVYAIGNALGEGIVARDGVLTSETMEPVSGAWKFLRFSAAASPGNSGGPLVDEYGRLLGIILQKSQSENLNFALPTGEFLKPNTDHSLELDNRYKFYNSIFLVRGKSTLSYELPADFLTLDSKMEKDMRAESLRMFKQFFQENVSEFFPKGKGSAQILDTSFSNAFPAVVSQTEGGIWTLHEPEKKDTVEISGGGRITYGNMNGLYFQAMALPKGELLSKYLSDSKFLMDYILKHVRTTRKMGPEEIQIVSYGKAKRNEWHKDSLGRKWLLQEFHIEYADSKMIVCSLPLPNGLTTVAMTDRAGNIDRDGELDLRKVLDYIIISYAGNLDQWRQYLSLKEFLPDQFTNAKLDYRDGKFLKLSLPDYAIELRQKEVEISAKTDLDMDFMFSLKNDKVMLKFGDLDIYDSSKNTSSVQIFKRHEPPSDAASDLVSEWEKMISGKSPYNNAIKRYGEGTSITSMINALNIVENGKTVTLFGVRYNEDGKASQKKMRQKMKSILSGIQPSRSMK